MNKNINILYHRDCADGFGAAWAAYQKLGYAGVSYHSCAYGEPPPEMEPGSTVYILDFSFPRSIMLKLIDGHELFLIDHHETAEEEIGDLPGCNFDTSHSGAVLAWRWFHEGSKTPEILLYVEDRDLWKWELPDSRYISAALESYPKDFGVWDQLDAGKSYPKDFGILGQLDARELTREGQAILRHNHLQVERIIQHSSWREIADWRVPVVNTLLLASEACEALLDKFPDAPFAAAYHDRGDQRKWSLRSYGEFDVSHVARSLGGGGHPHAAGFLTAGPDTTPSSRPR